MKRSEKNVSFRLWKVPGFVVLCSVLIAFFVVVLFQRSEDRKNAKALKRDAKALQEQIQTHSNEHLVFFQLLAKEIAVGSLDKESFQKKASLYVSDNPELIHANWVDADYVIRWIAPYEPGKRAVGLKLALPEPMRTSKLARDTRRPVYTRPFDAIQGKMVFVVHIPVFDGDIFPRQWWEKELEKSDTIYIPRVEDLPKEAEKSREFLLNRGVKSSVIVMMKRSGRPIGFVGVGPERRQIITHHTGIEGLA